MTILFRIILTEENAELRPTHADIDRKLMPTFDIHAANPLLNVRPGPCLGIGTCAIYCIALKGSLIVFSGVTVDIGICGASQQNRSHQKTGQDLQWGSYQFKLSISFAVIVNFCLLLLIFYLRAIKTLYAN